MNSLKSELKILKTNLYHHIDILTNRIGERNLYQFTALKYAYRYILNHFSQSTFTIKDSAYNYNNYLFHNIIAEKKGAHHPDEIFIIGAHYDTVYNSPGADDNASGIAALLEFIRLFDKYKNDRTLRLVAFTLEEPPFHATPNMGSYVYAQQCNQLQESILTMVSLEMLAYYTDQENTQKYPHPDMTSQFPSKGDFITIVGNDFSKQVVKQVFRGFKNNSKVPVMPMVAHSSTPGVDLSDHAPFWNLGYRAIMITDTAFYRNPHYHEPSDTIDTLNFKTYAQTVWGLSETFKQFDREGIL